MSECQIFPFPKKQTDEFSPTQELRENLDIYKEILKKNRTPRLAQENDVEIIMQLIYKYYNQIADLNSRTLERLSQSFISQNNQSILDSIREEAIKFEQELKTALNELKEEGDQTKIDYIKDFIREDFFKSIFEN